MPSLLQPLLRGRPHFLGHRGNRRPHFVQRDLLMLRRLVSALAYQKPVKLLATGQYGSISQTEIIRDVHQGPLWAVEAKRYRGKLPDAREVLSFNGIEA